MGEVQSHTRPSYFFQNSYLRKQSSNCFKTSLKNLSVLVLVCCGAGAVGSSGFGRHSGRGTSDIRLCPVGRKDFSCWKEGLFLLERNFFPSGRKDFSCWKEKLFLKVGQKVLNFRKFEWFTDGQLEEFFLSEGKNFPFVGKIFSCRKEKFFPLSGKYFPVGWKNLECKKDLTRQFT